MSRDHLAEIAELACRTAQAFAMRDACDGAEAEAHDMFATLLCAELHNLGAADVCSEMDDERFEGFSEACRLEYDNPSIDFIHAKAVEYCAVKRIAGGLR